MGLFSNKKNPCVLCGEPTPRLFAKEACGGKLCGDCGKQISMDEEILNDISLEDLKTHMEYRQENAKLHEVFRETRRVDFEGDKLVIDDENKLFYFTFFDGKNKPIFKFEELQGFAFIENMESRLESYISDLKPFQLGIDKVIHERGFRVVYELTKDERVKNESLIELYKEEYRGIAYSKNMVDHLLGLDEAIASEEKPVKQMIMAFKFNNPYWRTYKKRMLEPVVHDYNDEDEETRKSGQYKYIRDYERKLEYVKEVAEAMESILDA